MSIHHLCLRHPIFVFNHFFFFFTEHLEVGIPLPKILNVNFANSVVDVIEVSFPCGYVPGWQFS